MPMVQKNEEEFCSFMALQYNISSEYNSVSYKEYMHWSYIVLVLILSVIKNTRVDNV